MTADPTAPARRSRLPRVALLGPGGYGRVHLAGLAGRHRAGRLRLVAVADRPGAAPPELPDGTRFTTDWRGLVADADLDVAVIATPPHRHAEMALAAFGAGLDVLLEKPATLRVADLDGLATVARVAGVRCQVGFQSLGSIALDALCAALVSGELGEPTAVGVRGAWRRSSGYYGRADWAGRRLADGRPGDGTLLNPFAHAVVNGLVVAGAAFGRDAEPAHAADAVAAELYRAHDIEVDDTSSLRLRTTDGVMVTIATTLCADEVLDPVVEVRGSRGTAELSYQHDVLTLAGRTAELRSHRHDLLDDLLDARAQGRPLRCPLERTRPALVAVERATAVAGPPVPVPDRAVLRQPAHDGTSAVVVPGVTAAITRCSREALLLSETGPPWAAPVEPCPPGDVSVAGTG
ncbi:MAG: Gfo/Idh/MocA family protein [Kineosporiaceae bacterium]